MITVKTLSVKFNVLLGDELHPVQGKYTLPKHVVCSFN